MTLPKRPDDTQPMRHRGMETNKRRDFLSLAVKSLPLAMGISSTAAYSDEYPSRPIRMIVPHAAGTTPDVVARIITQQLARRMGQPFVVDNRPGAGGSIGMSAVAKAAADGYTLGMGHIGTLTINPAIYKNLPYDPIKNLAPVILAAKSPLLLVVAQDSPYNSMTDIIAAAKLQPGLLTYSSAGNGSASHLAGEYLKSSAGISLTHIPFKSTGEALTSLIAGDVTTMFAGLPDSAPFFQAKRLRPIAFSSQTRHTDHPAIPVIAETLAGFDLLNWTGVVAPKATPVDRVERLHRHISQVLAMPEVSTSLQALGLFWTPNTSSEFGRFIQVELDRWSRLAKEINLKLD